jgi:hypothetical protein
LNSYFIFLDFLKSLFLLKVYEKHEKKLEMFNNAYVNFTHFVTYMKEDERINPFTLDGLWDLVLHHGALQVRHNDKTLDIIIPIIFSSIKNSNQDFEIKKENISCILFQVKNIDKDNKVAEHKEFIRQARDMDMIHMIQKPYLVYWVSVGVLSRGDGLDTKKGFGYSKCKEYHQKQDEVEPKNKPRLRPIVGKYIKHVTLFTNGIGKIFNIPVDCLALLETLLRNHDRAKCFKLAEYYTEEEQLGASGPIAGGWLSRVENEVEDIQDKFKKMKIPKI